MIRLFLVLSLVVFGTLFAEKFQQIEFELPGEGWELDEERSDAQEIYYLLIGENGSVQQFSIQTQIDDEDNSEKFAFALKAYYTSLNPLNTCKILQYDNTSGLLKFSLYKNDLFLASYLQRYFLSGEKIHLVTFASNNLHEIKEKKENWTQILLKAKLVD
jgi:hypothetical protein